MKIMHVYDDERGERIYPPINGGNAFDIFYTCRHMARMGHDVTILERRLAKTDCLEENIDGVRLLRIEAKKYARPPQQEVRSIMGPVRLFTDAFIFARKANRTIKAVNPDVVHVHYPWAANVLIYLDRKLRKKMVYTAHIGDEVRLLRLDPKVRSPLYLRLFTPHLHLMQRIRMNIVINDELRMKLTSLGRVKAENLAYVHQGVDTESFNPNIDTKDIRQKYQMDGKVTILFAGTIIPRKGIDYLLKAAETVIKDHPTVIFLIAGDLRLNPDYVSRITQFIEEMKLGDKIKLLGYQPLEELTKLDAACDIFVLPSLQEGFGMVITEAMACGKPLIGSNVGGIPLQIKDGWNGFLVPAADDKPLAEKISYLVEHPEKRAEMGRNSRRLAEEEFDWSKMAERLIDVYSRIQQ